MSKSRIQLANAERYILGGFAEVIFHNTKSDNSFRFKVSERRDSSWAVFVGNLVTDRFIGNINIDREFIPKQYNHELQSQKVFQYVWTRIHALTLEDFIHVLHTGRCSVCSRKLTDTTSIELGIGPTCLERLLKKRNEKQN